MQYCLEELWKIFEHQLNDFNSKLQVIYVNNDGRKNGGGDKRLSPSASYLASCILTGGEVSGRSFLNVEVVEAQLIM